MKIFLAGHMGKEIPEEYITYKAPFVLQTFYDMRQWDDALIYRAITTPDIFFLDSGAFSFMNSGGNVDFEKYLLEYAKFVNKWDIQNYFELDLDVIIGVNETQKLTRKLEEITGKPCISVFHACRGVERWRQMTQKYRYVAIGASGITKECRWVKNKQALIALISIAHKNGCKVHGLGYTRLSNINNTTVPFDSVDSSACLSGGRFATVYKFTGTKLLSKSIKGKSAGYKILNQHNIQEWIKMQKYKAGITNGK